LLDALIMGNSGKDIGRRTIFATSISATVAASIATAGLGTVAWAGFIPGGGPERSDCYTELYVRGIENPSAQVQRNRVVFCTDGDACDTDVDSPYSGPACGNNRCEFEVAVCVGQSDPNLPSCSPAPLRDMTQHVKRLGVPGRDFKPDYVPRRSLLSSAFPWEWQKGLGPSCGQPVGMTVVSRVTNDGRQLPGRLQISVTAFAKEGFSPAADQDRIVLECLPRTTPCPDAPPSTTTTLPPISARPTVIVGAGGGTRFDPDTVRIRAGDTVRWLWEGKGYAVASGTPFQEDGLFCSPCGTGPALAGATFEHTFPEVGTFAYFNDWGFPMRGRVIVEP
jgi:plastocyanin